jgi:hypothetical protein
MYAGKRPDPMDFPQILEAVFQPELSRIFSGNFRPVPTGKYRQLAGIHRKNPKNFRSEYCFHFRGISGAFPRDTVAEIFDLGIFKNRADYYYSSLKNLIYTQVNHGRP